MKQKLLWLFVAVMLGMAPCVTLTSCNSSKSKTEKSGKKKKKKKGDSNEKLGDEEDSNVFDDEEIEFDESILENEIVVEDNGTSESDIDLTEPSSEAKPASQQDQASKQERKLNVPQSQDQAVNNKNRQTLNEIVSGEAKTLPREIGNGITWVQASIRGNEVIYLYEVNEKQNNMLSKDKEEMRQNLVEWLGSKVIKSFVSAVIAENMNVRYIYFGTHTRKTISLVATADALRKAMKQ